MVKVIPTEEMFQAWKAHPVSQLYHQMLAEGRQALRDQWEAGVFQGRTPLETAVANVGALSQCRLYKDLMEMNYEQFCESFDEEEYIRPAPTGAGGSGRAD